MRWYRRNSCPLAPSAPALYLNDESISLMRLLRLPEIRSPIQRVPDTDISTRTEVIRSAASYSDSAPVPPATQRSSDGL
jgi:hypothetical protein